MYASFFGLNETPFSITPDPRYVFLSRRHGEALGHLIYGATEEGGFTQLTGEVGTGKTTLVRTLLQDYLPQDSDVAVVLNPRLSVIEFLQTICEELEIASSEKATSTKQLVDTLNQHLLSAHAAGRRVVLIVDEAQGLSLDVLEQVRLLTNLETAHHKLLRIILVGQPELRDVLNRRDLRQINQRITGRYHLESLSRRETALYIRHRLAVSGSASTIFDAGAKRQIYRLSKGVPRLINIICNQALLGAYSLEQREIGCRLIRKAAAEVSGVNIPIWKRSPPRLSATAGIAVFCVVALAVIDGRDWQEPVLHNSATRESLDALGNPVTRNKPEQQDAALKELLASSKRTSMDEAFLALYRYWQIDEGLPDSPHCRAAVSLGFACIETRGTLDDLKRLDRPAILRLTDKFNKKHHVLLTRLDWEQAELSIDGAFSYHASEALAQAWSGEHTVLWRPENVERMVLGPGSYGKDVIWLRQMLAAVDDRYLAEPADSPHYDSVLAERVREFQRDQHLLIDGLAGFRTIKNIDSRLSLLQRDPVRLGS